MKSKLLLLFIISSCSLFGQSKKYLYNADMSLKDEAYFLTLFVDTANDSWDTEEVDYFFSQFEKSQEWIKTEAEFYDQEITFINDFFFFDNMETVYIEEITLGSHPIQLIQNVMKERGYDDFKHFLEKTKFKAPLGKLKIVLFVKDNGRSHAYNKLAINSVDIAIVYCRSTYGMITDHFVVAHEILHQFGAWDLYYGKSQTYESAKKAIELYPNSIMINAGVEKEGFEVDELTAWRIGWEPYHESFDQFDPASNQEKIRLENLKKNGRTIKFDLKKRKKEKN